MRFLSLCLLAAVIAPTHGLSRSLAFVIDTTGSMSGDIRMAIQGAVDLFNTFTAEDKSITNYVFAPFNDPTVGPPLKTTNRSLFLSTLRGITVGGGGDCPEKCLSGIVQALDTADPHSAIFVFTDAAAKDYTLKAEVIRKSVSAASPIRFLLTGNCPSLPTDETNAYDDIAKATNGQAYHVPASDIPAIVKKIAKNEFSGNQVSLAACDFNMPGVVSVEQDASISQVTLSASSSSSFGPLQLFQNAAPAALSVTMNNSLNVLGSLRTTTANKFTAVLGDVSSGGSVALRISGNSTQDVVFAFVPNPTQPWDPQPLPSTPAGGQTYLVIKPVGVSQALTSVEILETDCGVRKTISLSAYSQAARTGFQYITSDPIDLTTTSFRARVSQGSFVRVSTILMAFAPFSTLAPPRSTTPPPPPPVCSGHGTHSCKCDFGYTGPDCGKDIDFCAQETNLAGGLSVGAICSVHGTCVNHVGDGATCVCNWGWSGALCETPVPGKISVSRRCGLYATPAIRAENVTVGCPSGQRCLTDRLNCGFTKDCTNPIGWCVPNPAADSFTRASLDTIRRLSQIQSFFAGECSGHGTGSCTCDQGYTGANCETEINFCNSTCARIGADGGRLSGVCGPHGTCHSHPSGLTCSCAHGWSGPLCDQPIPADVTIAKRCLLYPGSKAPAAVPVGCPSGQRCLTDYLNCAFANPKCDNPIGWCLPQPTVDAIYAQARQML